MRKILFLAAAITATTCVSAFAERPSVSRLARLGLGALQIASDDVGSQVRGKFFGSVRFGFNSTVAQVIDLGDDFFVTIPTRSGTGIGFTFGESPRTLGSMASASGGTLQEQTVNSTETTSTAVTNGGTTVTTTTTVTSTGLMRVNSPFVAQFTDSTTGATLSAYSSGGVFFRGN